MWDFRQLEWLSYLGWWEREDISTRKRIALKIYGYVLYFFIFVQFGPELWAILSAIREKRLDVMVYNTNQMFLGILWLMEMSLLIRNGSKYKSILRKLEKMEKSVEGFLEPGEWRRLGASRRAVCARMAVPYAHLSIWVTLLWNFRPVFIIIIFGEKINIIDAWTPVDTNTFGGWLVMYVVHFVHTGGAVGGLILVHSFKFSLLQMYHLLHDFLNHKLRTLHFPYRRREKESRDDLKFCVRFHKQFIQLGFEINDIMKHMLFFQTIVFNCIICLSVFECTGMKTSNGVLRRTIILFLASNCVFILFIYCNFCQEQEETEGTVRALYENNWYEASVSERRVLCLMMRVAAKPRPFGFIINNNLDLFITMMKSTFSYYQFLKTITE